MIIDFHTHVFPAFFRNDRSAAILHDPAFKILYASPQAKLAGVQALIRHMDQAGVQRSVIFGFPWEDPDYFKRHNDYILESVNRYPDRLSGFCTFAPVSPSGPTEVERCLRQGLSGVGELAVYGSDLSRKVIEILGDVMVLCREADVPFLLHVNEPVGHHYPGKTPNTLRQVYDFVKAFPENRIVLAHWGGGLLFYALMKREVKAVLRQVWFDTAASPYLYTPDIYRVAGEIVGFEKILFGSDYPLLTPERYFKEMVEAGLTEENRVRIKGQNAAQLLDLG
ncbi:MAG: amidohydrolase family protein [Desulfatiglandaceae bacterium]